ncbi:Calx-beta domain-containing protein [Actinokineospora auranticolor]|uniref:Calx-beta domain-containing protein n=1 Tax=Actinokineospora auranticolor TaxID=155976 RepID=UPI001FE5469C|nr:Calx-beta domain-containing protein [Actinokineospora auranticolor]
MSAVVVVALAGAGLAVTPAGAAPPGVLPSTVDATLIPGGTTTVTKSVTTPAIPYNPDIVFLADTTGSMSAVIANVRSNIGTLTGNILTAQPSAQFAVAEFKDIKDTIPFRVNQQPTANISAVQAGTTQWVAAGGGDFPEDFINGLYRVASGDITFRPDSSRIVALFGDAPSHDPSNGRTLADAVTALQGINARVIAVNSSGLDAKGQAAALVSATGGVQLNNVPSSAVPQAILDGIKGTKVSVAPRVKTCAPELTVSNSPTSVSVTSGSVATFTETLTVSPSAAPGVYSCQVDYLVDGVSQGFVETTTVRVLGLSVGDITFAEPTSGTAGAVFTVTLNAAANAPVTVNYATANGTATAPADYTAASGTLTFAPGETSKTVTVQVAADTIDEPSETFTLTLSGASGATILRATGTATITDSDRDGTWTCSAGAARLALLQTTLASAAQANSPNDPCVEETPTLINANLSSGILSVLTGDVDATTDLIPNDQQTAVANGDGVRSSSNIAGATISLLGLANISVGAVTASAGFTCSNGTPVYSASSNVASLKVNGLTVAVGNGPLTIPLVVGTLKINTDTIVNGQYVRQAFALDTSVATVILGEAKVGYKGTSLHPSGNPCSM